MDDREVSWGTHTIPQWNPDLPVKERNLANSNWTSGKPPLRKDEAYRARRRAKGLRHEKNKEAKAEANRTRSSNQGRR